MPSEVALRLSPTTPKDNLFFNAFSDAEPTVTTNTGTMISETIPRKRRPTLQRRGSDSTPSSTSRNNQLVARPLGHSRSQTEQWNPDVHPLGTATFGRSTTAGDSGITRPHLSRIMSAWDSPAGSDGEAVGSSDAGSLLEPAPAQEVEEKAVLVHEVSSKDSLAGVALKYRITIAELRKVNQLWATDSIHLRKVLYIPLDCTTQSKKSRPAPLVDLETIPTLPSDPKPPTSTIRRVPVSQLSFFPPPSKPSALPADPDDLFHDQYSSTTSSARAGSSTQPLRALSSILTAFPLAASTRDTIIARLSFDSERTSLSDDQEHELDEVQASTVAAKPRFHSSSSRGSMARTPSSHSSNHAHTKVSPKFVPRNITSPESIPTITVDHQKSWTNTNAMDTLTAIRTVQMEPSPAMKVPPLKRPKSQPKDPLGSGATGLGVRDNDHHCVT